MTSLTSSSPPSESTPVSESSEPVPAISPTSPISKAMQSTSSSKNPSPPEKITVLLKAVGNAPIMVSKNWAVNSSDTVRDLMQKLRKILRLQAGDSLFVYVNQSFAPSPEHTIGLLHQCFGGGAAATSSGMDTASAATPKKLTLHYSTTQAWG